MKKILICIAKIILVIIVLFTKLFYLPRSVILHLGAGLRYGSLRIFRPKQKISYKDIRYGSDDFSVIDFNDHEDTTWEDVERVFEKASAKFEEQI